MAKAKTTKIATINTPDGENLTRKVCRSQIREALKGLGLTCGLFESNKGKSYKATITGSDFMVAAERKRGAPVTVNASKAQLTKLAKAIAAERAEAKAEREEAREILAAVENEPDIPVSDLQVFSLMSMDEQGRLTSTHPRNGGLSAGAIRAMLESDGYEVEPRMRKADLVDMLMAVVSGGGVVAPVAEKPKAKSKSKGKVLKFETGAVSPEIQF